MFQLIARNIKTRYKRSALGIVWTMIHPLMMMIVLTLAFSSVFRVAVPHFAVYVLSGLLLWNFFSQTTNSAMSELLWGGNTSSQDIHSSRYFRGIQQLVPDW